MNLLLYTGHTNRNNSDGGIQRLMGVVATLTNYGQIEIYQSFNRFVHKLRQLPRYNTVAIIYPHCNDDLTDILTICDLLSDIRVILILPDHHQETVSRGFKLFPRYVSYADSDFSDVGAVLSKMNSLTQMTEMTG